MARTRQVYNPSRCITETARLVICPHCKGAGGCITDKDATCPYCKGYGELWMTDNSCIMPLYGRFERDETLY